MRRKTVIAKNVYLYSTKVTTPCVSISYEIECACFQCLQFELSFDGSVNFTLDVSDSSASLISPLRLSHIVPPYKRVFLGTIRVNAPSQRAVLCLEYNWTFEDLSINDWLADSGANKKYIENELQRVKELQLHRFTSLADIDIHFTNHHLLYIDASFPPTNTSLGSAQLSHPAYSTLAWYRPRTFMTGEYDIFEGGIEPDDIRQGALANCWFLSALSSLAEFPALVMALFPDSSVSPLGVYSVRMCLQGLWRDVIIDDYFPCFPTSGPVFSRCHGNELWVMLVEKAYAKAAGSYAATKLGLPHEAMLDLTGAPYELFTLADCNESLWDTLLRYDQLDYLMSACTTGVDLMSEATHAMRVSDSGLVSGHAYTLLVVKQLSNGAKLVQLRNPWGEFEWQGAWSDGSSCWTPELREEVGMVNDDDGTFWMSIDDLLEHFESVSVCMVRPLASPWKEIRRKGWLLLDNDYQNDGRMSVLDHLECSMYILKVSTPTTVYISVHQAAQRDETSTPYADIGISLLKLNKDHTLQYVSCSGIGVARQHQIQSHLNNGIYIIVPLTSGSKLLNYDICHYATKEAALCCNKRFVVDAERAMEEVFHRFDVDCDEALSRLELNALMSVTEGREEEVDDKVFDWLVSTFESTDTGLTLQGYKQAQYFMLQKCNYKEEVLLSDFKLLGYNNDLKLTRSRGLTVVCHSDESVVMELAPFDRMVYQEALETCIRHLGRVSQYEDGQIKIYVCTVGLCGVGIAAENCGEAPLEVEIDCAASLNTASHRGSLVSTATLRPMQFVIMHFLFPDSEGEWNWEYKANATWL